MKSPEAEMQRLFDTVHTLVIASINEDGSSHASYAPYVRDENGNLYVFISQLAQHTRNLLKNKLISVLIAEDEQQTRQLFAKTRLTYQCQVQPIQRDQAEFAVSLDIMERQFGETVQILRGLADFHLFRLEPITGVFVMGFGQAYELDGKHLHHGTQIKS